MSRENIHPLRIARTHRNLTQKRLAEETGVGAQTILRAEQKKPINAESRKLLCDYFDTTPERLGLVEGKANEFEQVVRSEVGKFIPEYLPSESEYQSLAEYFQQQKANLYEALAPSTDHLQMQDIIGIEGSFFLPPWKLFGGDHQHTDLLEYLMSEVREGKRILLLGKAGQGKTTILKQIFTRMVDDFCYNTNSQTLVPLYIPLREVNDATLSSIELLWEYLRPNFPLTLENFALLVRTGKITFLFDGFDEIQGYLGQQSINKRASSKFFAFPCILSCRKGFYDFYLSTSVIQEKYVQKIELLPLILDNSITRFIQAFYTKKWNDVYPIVKSEEIIRTIRESQVLQDLIARPLLLVMALDIFTESKEVNEVEWNRTKLYQKYIEKWLKNEAAKPDSVLTWSQKTTLMQEIAWSTYITKTSVTARVARYESITFTQSEIGLILENFFARYQPITFASLMDDVCFRTLLVGGDGDSYYFIHKSFQEYYIAKYILDQIKRKKCNIDSVVSVLQEFHSFEVSTFLKEMLTANDFSEHNKNLVIDTLILSYEYCNTNDYSSTVVRQNASHYLAFLGTQKAALFLEQMYLQETSKWVQRGMMVGLALFCDRVDILERYIQFIRTDSEAASINTGYHLVYYGDQALEAGYYDKGNRQCEGTVKSIFRRLSNERYKNGWVLDLFTLRSLLEQRSVAVLSSNKDYLPSLKNFLQKDHKELGGLLHQEKKLLQEKLERV